MKEIDLLKLLKLLFSKIVLIVLCGAVGATLGLGYSLFFVTPVYRTSASILVNNGGLSDQYNGSTIVSGSNIAASLGLVNTCVDILSSDKIYEDLSQTLGNEYSPATLKSAFTPTARGNNSLLIDIYTYSSNPDEAKSLANAFLEIVPTFISNTIPNADVKVLATATRVTKTEPRTTFNMGIGGLAGVLLCSVVIIIISLIKNTIDSEKDYKSNYEIPLLGTVPVFENNTKKGGGCIEKETK